MTATKVEVRRPRPETRAGLPDLQGERAGEAARAHLPLGRVIPPRIFADPFLPSAGAKLEQVKGYADWYESLARPAGQ
jgi:hypothetical protein